MRAVLWSVRLLFAAVLLGTAQNAAATVTITLEWSGCGGEVCSGIGTSSITVWPLFGQTLRLDVYLSHNLTQGLSAHTFSLNFDTGGQNELNLGPMAPLEWGGSDVNPNPAVVENYGPFTTGVTTHESPGLGGSGRINSFESGSLGAPLPANNAAYSVGTYTATAPARYRVGQAFFTTTAASDADAADIFSGRFNGLFDVTVDGNGTEVPQNTFIYGTAAVNPGDPIPEPGTVALLGLGLVGLVLASRGRGRAG